MIATRILWVGLLVLALVFTVATAQGYPGGGRGGGGRGGGGRGGGRPFRGGGGRGGGRPFRGGGGRGGRGGFF